jgi:hypothetical protein
MKDVLPENDEQSSSTLPEPSDLPHIVFAAEANAQTSDSQSTLVSETRPTREEEEVQTAPMQISQRRTSIVLYGFCLLACFVGFVALLIRRLGNSRE